MKKIFLILLFFNIVFTYSDEVETISISINPVGVMPFGENAASFKTGGGLDLAVDLNITPLLFIRTEANYEYIPLATKDGLSIFSIFAGAGLKYTIFDKLTLSVSGTGGYYYGFITDDSGSSGGNISLSGSISTFFNITPSFSLGISANYTSKTALYSSLNLSLGTTFYPGHFSSSSGRNQYTPSVDLLEARSPGVSGTGLDVETIRFNQIFPVLFKYYDSNPVGTVKLYNNESSPITDVTLSFFVDRYMDNPKQSPPIENIEGKSAVNFDIYALFSDSVLEITEGTKVSTNVILKYTQKGKNYTRKYVTSMDIYDRNAITWDDDRKAAAFVTAKDPAVLEFAKKISGWIKQISSPAINKNLSIAMGIHNSLTQYGITYQVDPKTPFTEFSKDKLSVDFLQFPRQTLTYSSGDCDDLSILYSALLESVGIETAFITIPGHIYMAFSLNIDPAEAEKTFLKPEDLIFVNDKVWLPIEVTMVQDNFLDAWAMGAKEWRENAVRNQAKFYPMHDSWKKYKPVGLPGNALVSLPDKESLENSFQLELTGFIDREIYPQVSRLEKQISQNNNEPRYINRLGVLYARYGLNGKAADLFGQILTNTEYVPSLINIGNISFLNKYMKEALGYYQRASGIEPDNPIVLLSIARASHELENYGMVREAYEKLKLLDPELAERFSYLDLRGEEATRAAEINEVMGVVVWDGE